MSTKIRRHKNIRELRINKEKAKSFLEKLEKGKKVPLPLVPIKISKLLKNFILNGGSKLEY